MRNFREKVISMKLRNVKEVEEFLATVKECKGGVVLTSMEGDRYNLKSTLSQYVAIGKLLSEQGQDLELWCDRKEDEGRFLKFFSEHPDVIHLPNIRKAAS